VNGSDPQVRELFRAHALRHTRQRELVYRALASTKRHPTAEELHVSVRAIDGAISLATVYNTLDALHGSGLCRKLAAPDQSGGVRYDADTHEHLHVTTPDGRMTDVPMDLSRRVLDAIGPTLRAEIESRMGVELDRVTVHLSARTPTP
jgi:Fur family peroxide stress response transcriptional regulator